MNIFWAQKQNLQIIKQPDELKLKTSLILSSCLFTLFDRWCNCQRFNIKLYLALTLLIGTILIFLIIEKYKYCIVYIFTA